MRFAIAVSLGLAVLGAGSGQVAAQVGPAGAGAILVPPAYSPGQRSLAPEVRVMFVVPAHYTDANLYNGTGEKAIEPALREIRTKLQQLGAQYLHPGEILSIEVLDVDLAGRFEPWRPLFQDVRFMREVTWPRIKLRYSLQSGVRQPLRGEEEVSDQTYLMKAAITRNSSEIMSYEKAMLEDWFRARFAQPRS